MYYYKVFRPLEQANCEVACWMKCRLPGTNRFEGFDWKFLVIDAVLFECMPYMSCQNGIESQCW